MYIDITVYHFYFYFFVVTSKFTIILFCSPQSSFDLRVLSFFFFFFWIIYEYSLMLSRVISVILYYMFTRVLSAIKGIIDGCILGHLYGCTISWSSLHHLSIDIVACLQPKSMRMRCLRCLRPCSSPRTFLSTQNLVCSRLDRHFLLGNGNTSSCPFSGAWRWHPAASFLCAAAVMERDVAHARLSSWLRTPTSIRRRGWATVLVAGGVRWRRKERERPSY